MSWIKFDGIGCTEVLLHYFPSRRVIGLILLEDQEAGCYALDVLISGNEDPDLDGPLQYTAYSSADVSDVLAVANALSVELWGEEINIEAMKQKITSEAKS